MNKEIKKQIEDVIDLYKIVPSVTVALANEIERILDSCPLEKLVSLQTVEDENYKKVFEKFGETHTIQKIPGTSVTLADLKDNQSVCWGDGKSYCFLLTEKENRLSS